MLVFNVIICNAFYVILASYISVNLPPNICLARRFSWYTADTVFSLQEKLQPVGLSELPNSYRVLCLLPHKRSLAECSPVAGERRDGSRAFPQVKRVTVIQHHFRISCRRRLVFYPQKNVSYVPVHLKKTERKQRAVNLSVSLQEFNPGTLSSGNTGFKMEPRQDKRLRDPPCFNERPGE